MWGIILLILIIVVLAVGGYLLFKYGSELVPEPPTPPTSIDDVLPKDLVIDKGMDGDGPIE